jgi:hypothetical protein
MRYLRISNGEVEIKFKTWCELLDLLLESEEGERILQNYTQYRFYYRDGSSKFLSWLLSQLDDKSIFYLRNVYEVAEKHRGFTLVSNTDVATVKDALKRNFGPHLSEFYLVYHSYDVISVDEFWKQEEKRNETVLPSK